MASVHFCSLKQDTEKDFQGNVFWGAGGLGAVDNRKVGCELRGCELDRMQKLGDSED